MVVSIIIISSFPQKLALFQTQRIKGLVQTINTGRRNSLAADIPLRYNSSAWVQFKMLIKREFVNLARDKGRRALRNVAM
jgi:hypothetical protein